MSLFLPTGRAGPEETATPAAPVATIGESHTAMRSSTWLEPKSVNSATDQTIGHQSESPSAKVAHRPRRSPMFIVRPSQPTVQLRQERSVTPDGVGPQEGRGPNYKHLVPGGAVNTASDQSETEGAPLNAQPTGATTYRYDDLNRLIEVIHADGTRITYIYDAAGNLMQTVTRPR